MALAAAAATIALLATACRGSGDGEASPGRDRVPAATSSTEALRPSLRGGLALPAVEPAALLVGDGLLFGEVLPSEAAGLSELTAQPEVASGLSRRVFEPGGRHIGSLVVLSLRSEAFFDQAVLDGWREGLVAALAGAPRATLVEVAGDAAVAATGRAGSAVAVTEGSAVAVVLAESEADATLVAASVRVAYRRGDPGRPDPATPMRPFVPGAVFVGVPAVSFVPFPIFESQGPAPVAAGFGPVEVRIVAMGGERRAVAWAFGSDPAVRASAEAVQAGLAEAVGGRAGSSARTVELRDRVSRHGGYISFTAS